MTDAAETPGGEDYLTTLAGIVADASDVAVELARAQVRELRMLAAAGRLAEAQTAQRNARVQVHDMALRSIAAEVGGVMRVTDRTVQRRIGEARTLVEGFPATVEAWEQGRIIRGHAIGKHALQEENAVYAMMRDRGMPEAADHLNHEHGYVKQYFFDLGEMAKDDPAWLPKLREFRTMIEQHMREEENDLFPRLRAELSDAQNAHLTRQMNKEGLKLA